MTYTMSNFTHYSFVNLGAVPRDEVEVRKDDPNYATAVLKSAARYMNLIEARLGKPPSGAYLAFRTLRDDGACKMEVVCYYDREDKNAHHYALRCKEDAPRTWHG